MLQGWPGTRFGRSKLVDVPERSGPIPGVMGVPDSKVTMVSANQPPRALRAMAFELFTPGRA